MHKKADEPGAKEDLMAKYAHLMKGEAKKAYKEATQYGGSFESTDLLNIFEEFENLKSSENTKDSKS